MDGLTGKIKFDSQGLRTDFQLEIVELKKDGLQKVIYYVVQQLVKLYVLIRLLDIVKEHNFQY